MKRGKLFVLALAALLVGATATVFAQSGATGAGRTRVTAVNVTITVNTPGAQVTINGQSKASPALFTLNPGTYSVTLQARGYRAEQRNLTIDAAKGSSQTFAFALQSAQHRLTVQAPVRDAVVTVNRVAKGTVPYVEMLPAGMYSVVVSARGYADFAQTVQLDQDTVVNAQLRATTFRLTVQSPVRDAVVTVNRVAKGPVPYTEDLPMGTYAVVVSARGFDDFNQTVQLDRDTVVNAQLRSTTFRLTVQSPVRDAVVTVNRVAKGPVPYTEELPMGTYTVVVSGRGHDDFTQTVQLDRDTVVNADLKSSMATLILPVKYLEGDVQFVRLYVDGKLVSPQVAARGAIQVQPGKRLIRLASAPVGLAVEGELVFSPGQRYELELLLQFVPISEDSDRDNRNDNRGNDNRGNR